VNSLAAGFFAITLFCAGMVMLLVVAIHTAQ